MEGHELERSLVQKFRSADKDGNGVIDRSELAALLSAFEDGAEESEEQWCLPTQTCCAALSCVEQSLYQDCCIVHIVANL